MPLPKRCVEPVHVSRGTVPERLNVPSELEAVTNGTLANTVRQLSSLSKHAEDMFGELTREASNLAERTNVLQARIDRLAIKVTQLDSGVEEVSLQDIQMRKAFRSSRTFQQQLFSRNSMPTAMLATYARCDRPPPLERLNEFRDDGRDARKFYTDPDYFFELWRREMLQDTERIQHDRGKKVRQPRSGGGADGRGARRVRPPHSTRERQKAAAVTRGEHIMAPAQLRHYNIEPQPPPLQTQLSQQSIRQESVYATSVTDGGYRVGMNRPPSSQAARPNSIEIENHQNRQPRLTGNGHVMVDESPYGSVEPIYGGSGAGTPRRPRPSVPPPAPPADTPNNHTPTRSTLPPPPPPPEGTASPPMMNGASPPHRTALDAHLDHMHAVIGMMSSEEGGAPLGALALAPAPPPAPPAPLPPAPPEERPPEERPAEARPRPPSPGSLLRGASALKPSSARPAAEPKEDPRSDLLKAIRDGIKLRKVDKRGEETTGRYDTLRGAPAFLDVASILARRVAVELSDTSSGADSDSDDSDQVHPSSTWPPSSRGASPSSSATPAPAPTPTPTTPTRYTLPRRGLHPRAARRRRAQRHQLRRRLRLRRLRPGTPFLDVASILARRVAVELSDTSSGADSDSDDSDQVHPSSTWPPSSRGASPSSSATPAPAPTPTPTTPTRYTLPRRGLHPRAARRRRAQRHQLRRRLRLRRLRPGTPFLDVASILARRVAVELSDTSSGADSDSDDSDQVHPSSTWPPSSRGASPSSSATPAPAPTPTPTTPTRYTLPRRGLHPRAARRRRAQRHQLRRRLRLRRLRPGTPFLDVASILARRVAVELSDTSSGADSDSDDSDQWTTESRA
ncbi:actin-binding protein WASF3 isoform X2 [Cydia splendana]|uniref:actin-binding protein WASF3 isoform X2 n=1 Tax=Cydia splendana TaxID=1100963 RepID=UPI00300C87F1